MTHEEVLALLLIIAMALLMPSVMLWIDDDE